MRKCIFSGVAPSPHPPTMLHLSTLLLALTTSSAVLVAGQSSSARASSSSARSATPTATGVPVVPGTSPLPLQSASYVYPNLVSLAPLQISLILTTEFRSRTKSIRSPWAGDLSLDSICATTRRLGQLRNVKPPSSTISPVNSLFRRRRQFRSADHV